MLRQVVGQNQLWTLLPSAHILQLWENLSIGQGCFTGALHVKSNLVSAVAMLHSIITWLASECMLQCDLRGQRSHLCASLRIFCPSSKPQLLDKKFMAVISGASMFACWTILATDRWYIDIEWCPSDEMWACQQMLILMAIAGLSNQTRPILWTKREWFCFVCDHDPCLRSDPPYQMWHNVFGKLVSIAMPPLLILIILAFWIVCKSMQLQKYSHQGTAPLFHQRASMAWNPWQGATACCQSKKKFQIYFTCCRGAHD